MKKLTVFAVAVAGLWLLVPADGLSIGHVHVAPRPGPVAPKAVPPPRPVVINRTPAPGPNVVRAVPPVRGPVPVQPKVIVPVAKIHEKFPAAPAHVDMKTFVDNNRTKFAGVSEKRPAVKQFARVEPPQMNAKFGGKTNAAVVRAFHDKLGKKTFVAGGKTFNIANQRADLIDNYRQQWSERVDARHERADLVRAHLGGTYNRLFTPDWWGHHRNVRSGWWGRWPGFADRWFAFAGGFWWQPVVPWDSFTAWAFGPALWGPPFYYDYGGNIVFDDGVAYVEGQPVGTDLDYANQAFQLAASGAAQLDAAPPSPDTIQAQWLPLGAYALCSGDPDAGDPTMFLQLAVNKQGVLLGTYYNAATDEAQPVVGAIDPNTQRTAWYLGDDKSIVLETGAYNLTAAETQVLVHFGTDRSQIWMMVRMQGPPPQ
jgi:hypothetical protein